MQPLPNYFWPLVICWLAISKVVAASSDFATGTEDIAGLPTDSAYYCSSYYTLVVLCSKPLIRFLSQWDSYSVISLEAVADSPYCNTLEWFWWD